jgi:SHS2 domain-containing protein
MKDFETFEHKADIGVRGFGATVEEAFENGAKAMFSVMVDIERVERRKEIKVACEAPDEELLFVEWLNALLAQKDVEEMTFSDFKVKRIRKEGVRYVLEGSAFGEVFDSQKHRADVEVKAATYSQLKVFKEGTTWTAQCIVDV